MSYFTHVDFQFSDELPAMPAILDTARVYLTAQAHYSVDDVLDSLGRGLADGNFLFKGLVSQDFDGLMTAISAAFPSIRFYVRGMGEEYGDVWLRQFEGGKAIARTGPFEDE